MPPATRQRAAEAFWRDTESPDIQVQQMEVVATLARRLNFRAKSILSLPVERKARHLAQLSDVTDAVAMRALVAYHFAEQRPLMGAFLDGLGLAHDNGLITAEDVKAPEKAQIAAALDAVRAAGTFATEEVDFYLRTLASLDTETWANVDAVLEGQSA
jgi:hypothetical protein